MSNTGHGHVYPREDGATARCGGPSLCSECASDFARKTEEDRRAAMDSVSAQAERLYPEGTPGYLDRRMAWMNGYATQAKRLSEMEAEIERMNKIYMSAVKQRGEFRQALRESREETKATDLAADMQRLDYAAELDALKAQLAAAIDESPVKDLRYQLARKDEVISDLDDCRKAQVGEIASCHAELDALKAQLAVAVEALKDIARPTYGTEPGMDDKEFYEIISRHLQNKRIAARKALAKLESKGAGETKKEGGE